MRMASTKALTLGVAVVLAIAAVTAHAQQCGMRTDGMECPNNLCCSFLGICGLDANHCGEGCQSGACYKSKRCGMQADTNSTTCPNNHCCSSYGYCGYGQKYWQRRANIKCSAGKACLSNYCCSKFGYCGLGIEFCGEGCQSGACHAGVAAQ